MAHPWQPPAAAWGSGWILTGYQKFAVSVTFSPNGEVLASGGGNADKTIVLWDLRDTDAPASVLQGHDDSVLSVAFSPDGTLLSSSSEDSTVRVWELGHPTTEKTALSVPLPYSAQFSPDGSTLASGSLEGTYLWDVADLAAAPTVLHVAKGWMLEIAFSPDGTTLAVAGDVDPIIRLHDLANPETPGVELHGHELFPLSLAFSPDGSTLASGGKDTTVRLWDLRHPDRPSTILGRHDDEVSRVRFSPDGTRLATSSADRSVRVWNLEAPDTPPALLVGHKDDVWGLAFSPDGTTLASGSADIRLWDMTHPLTRSTATELAERVCDRVWRNLTLDEWHQFVGEDIPYERTCPNLPIHPSLLETAEKRAKAGDLDGAVALFARAVALDPSLDLDPRAEAARLAPSAEP